MALLINKSVGSTLTFGGNSVIIIRKSGSGSTSRVTLMYASSYAKVTWFNRTYSNDEYEQEWPDSLAYSKCKEAYNALSSSYRNCILRQYIKYRTSTTTTSGEYEYMWLPSYYELGFTDSYVNEYTFPNASLNSFLTYASDDAYTRTRAKPDSDFSVYAKYDETKCKTTAGGTYSDPIHPCFVLYGTQKVSGSTILTSTASSPSAPTITDIPENVQSGSSLTISWSTPTVDSDASIKSYTIARSTDGGSSYTDLSTSVTSTSYTDTVPTSGTSLRYRVRVTDSLGHVSDWAYSNTATIVYNSAPTAPSSITVPSIVDVGDSISISWGTSTDTDGNLSGYKLYRSSDSGSTYTLIYTGTGTSYTDTTTDSDYSVIYRVCAYDSDSATSDYRTASATTVNHAPAAPATITVPDGINAATSILIQWDAATDTESNLSGYILERSTDSGASYTQIYSGTAVSYTDEVPICTKIIYRVKAYDDRSLESDYTTSDEKDVTILATGTPPTDPTDISISSKSENYLYESESVTISWGESTDVDNDLLGYKLERSTDGGVSYTQIYVGTDTTYTDVVPTDISTITYRVKAYDDGYNESAYVSVTKSVTVLEIPDPDSSARDSLSRCGSGRTLNNVPVGYVFYVRSNREDKETNMRFLILAQNYEAELNGEGRTLVAWIGNDSFVFKQSFLNKTESKNIVPFSKSYLEDTLNTTIFEYLKTWCDNSFVNGILDTTYYSWNTGDTDGSSTATSKIFTLSASEMGITDTTLGYSEGSEVEGATILKDWLFKQYVNTKSFWTRTPSQSSASSSVYSGVAAKMSVTSSVDYKLTGVAAESNVSDNMLVIPVFTINGSRGYLYREKVGNGFLAYNNGKNEFAPNPAYLPTYASGVTDPASVTDGQIVWLKTARNGYEDIPLMKLRSNYDTSLNPSGKSLYVMINAWPAYTMKTTETPTEYNLNADNSSTTIPFGASDMLNGTLNNIYNYLSANYEYSVVTRIQNTMYDSTNAISESTSTGSQLFLLSPEELGCASYNGDEEGDSLLEYNNDKGYYAFKKCLLRKYGLGKTIWTRTVSSTATEPYSGITSSVTSEGSELIGKDYSTKATDSTKPASIIITAGVVREIRTVVKAEWTAPTNPSGTLDHYVVQATYTRRNGTSVDWTTVSSTSTNTSVLFMYGYPAYSTSDATNDTSYTSIAIRVAYVDTDGNQSDYTTSATTTIYDSEFSAADTLSSSEALVFPAMTFSSENIILEADEDSGKLYLKKKPEVVQDTIDDSPESANVNLDECEFVLRDNCMKEIKVIENFDSMIWTERCYAAGDFELYMKYSLEAITEYMPGYYITFNKDKGYNSHLLNYYTTVMQIQDVEIEWDADEGTHLRIKGESVQSMLKQRVLTDFGESSVMSATSNNLFKTQYPASSFVGIAQKYVFGDLVTDSKRKFRTYYPTLFYEYDNADKITKGYLDVDWYGKTLYEIMESVSALGICWDTRWYEAEEKTYWDDPSGKTKSYFYTYMYLPADKSTSVVYSAEDGNLASSSFAYKSSDSVTTAYVYGYSSSSDDASTTVTTSLDLVGAIRECVGGSATGFLRREVALDVRSNITPDYDSNNNPIINATYHTRLQNYGNDYITENKIAIDLDGDVNDTTIKGGLGNIVSIADPYGDVQKRQITEVIWTVDEDGVHCYPTFSDPIDYVYYDSVEITSWNYIRSWLDISNFYSTYMFVESSLIAGLVNNNIQVELNSVAQATMVPRVYLKDFDFDYSYKLGSSNGAIAKIVGYNSTENYENNGLVAGGGSSPDFTLFNESSSTDSVVSTYSDNGAGPDDVSPETYFILYYKSYFTSSTSTSGGDYMTLKGFNFKFLGTRTQPPAYSVTTSAFCQDFDTTPSYTMSSTFINTTVDGTGTQYGWEWGNATEINTGRRFYPLNSGVASSVAGMALFATIDMTDIEITWSGQSEASDKFSIWTSTDSGATRTYLYGPSGNSTLVTDQTVTLSKLSAGTLLGFTYKKDSSTNTGIDKYFVWIQYTGNATNSAWTTWWETYGKNYSSEKDT